jgi:hypothetical protein
MVALSEEAEILLPEPSEEFAPAEEMAGELEEPAEVESIDSEGLPGEGDGPLAGAEDDAAGEVEAKPARKRASRGARSTSAKAARKSPSPRTAKKATRTGRKPGTRSK